MYRDSPGALVASARVARVCEDGHVDIVGASPTDCGSCRGACFLLPPRAGSGLRLPVDAAWLEGDAIEVELPAVRLLEVAAAVYGVPLAGLVLGAATGYALGSSDLACLAGALVGVALAVWLVVRFNARLERLVLAGLELRSP